MALSPFYSRFSRQESETEKGRPCLLPGSRVGVCSVRPHGEPGHENPRGGWNALARREAATVLELMLAALQ